MTWAVFDYGVGNLHSLRKALEACGAATEVTRDAGVLAKAEVAVLPGVGAFGHVMDALGDGAAALRERHKAGHPILGVCIGHQILYEGSAETPDMSGVGILPGRVEKLPASGGKVPHMGWNTLATDDPTMAAAGHVYYVHSYAARPGERTVATTEYGMTFSAADVAGNTIGLQFHPEKSGAGGLAILQDIVHRLENA